MKLGNSRFGSSRPGGSKSGDSGTPRGAVQGPGAGLDNVSRTRGFESLPSMAAPERGARGKRPGCGTCVLLVLLLAGAGALAGWNFLDDGQRGEIRSALVSTMRDRLPQAALELLRELMPMLDAAPPVPPINASGDGGVLPERKRAAVPVRTEDGALVFPIGPDAQDAALQDAGEDAARDGDEVAAGSESVREMVSEDARVRQLFVDDLAAWVVERFSPGRRGGSLAVSVQGANLRYGTGMIGFEGAEQGARGRAAILAHVFTPTMVRGIYELYADSFLRSIAAAAKTRGLDDRQLKSLYQVLGSRCTLHAGGLEGVAATTDLRGRLEELARREDAVVAATRAHLDARFDLEQARDAGRSLAPFEARVAAAARAVQEATSRNRRAEAALAEDIRRNGAGSLNQETALYLARWVGRRLESDPGAMESVRAASAVLRDLASRCARAAREGAPAQSTAPAAGQGTQSTPSSPGAPQSVPGAEPGP